MYRIKVLKYLLYIFYFFVKDKKPGTSCQKCKLPKHEKNITKK